MQRVCWWRTGSAGACHCHGSCRTFWQPLFVSGKGKYWLYWFPSQYTAALKVWIIGVSALIWLILRWGFTAISVLPLKSFDFVAPVGLSVGKSWAVRLTHRWWSWHIEQGQLSVSDECTCQHRKICSAQYACTSPHNSLYVHLVSYCV